MFSEVNYSLDEGLFSVCGLGSTNYFIVSRRDTEIESLKMLLMNDVLRG
jgi:hypothetical protein